MVISCSFVLWAAPVVVPNGAADVAPVVVPNGAADVAPVVADDVNKLERGARFPSTGRNVGSDGSVLCATFGSVLTGPCTPVMAGNVAVGGVRCTGAGSAGKLRLLELLRPFHEFFDFAAVNVSAIEYSP